VDRHLRQSPASLDKVLRRQEASRPKIDLVGHHAVARAHQAVDPREVGARFAETIPGVQRTLGITIEEAARSQKPRGEGIARIKRERLLGQAGRAFQSPAPNRRPASSRAGRLTWDTAPAPP
jgi:hypothetical protein